MSKLLLILDSEKLNDSCLAAHKYVARENLPDWCPLRPMPEKKWEPDETDSYEGGYADGWNDCLGEIEKEGRRMMVRSHGESSCLCGAPRFVVWRGKCGSLYGEAW